jgi:hypothetical protein
MRKKTPKPPTPNLLSIFVKASGDYKIGESPEQTLREKTNRTLQVATDIEDEIKRGGTDKKLLSDLKKRWLSLVAATNELGEMNRRTP